MKKIIRDVFITLVSLTGISMAYRWYLSRKGPLVRVVAFHDVPDAEWFERVIAYIAERYHVITPTDFHNKSFHPNRINILITFDDGYQSWVDACLPVLEKYECVGLFFINSGLMEVAEQPKEAEVFVTQQLRLTPKKVLSWGGVRDIIAAGHVIGGHTENHTMLATISASQIEAEVCTDKDVIEKHISVGLKDFAYPFGRKEHYGADAVRVVCGTKYSYGYAGETGFYVPPQQYEIPRTMFELGQTNRSIRYWIEGGYDIFDMFKKLCAR